MSASSRSQSSSPDILGPPGDAQYLISSPIKPFAGRQSWMSPMIGKSRTLAKRPRGRPRVSLSPAKSAHSIQFNDVILPGSPTMKFNGGRQRSISPEKLQDGNVSPWRIRLTLEATQDEDDENRGSPSRKRFKPSTMTTMIPLKDERSPLKERTPLKRRGRPRKSDMALSPFPGGAGHTPSPGHTPGPRVDDSQPRKRGRPRGTPKPKLQDFQLLDDQPTPTAEYYDHTFSPMDIVPNSDARQAQSSPMGTMSNEAGLGQHEYSPMDTIASEASISRQRFSRTDPLTSDAGLGQERFSPTDSFAGSNAHASPLNLVGDADSEDDSWGNSDLSIAELPDPTEPIMEDLGNRRREYGRTSLETPVIGATEHHFLDDENIHSTPSKMPSPTRERAILSSRPSHNTSSPQSRTYPTPTPTSSLADEENQTRQADVDHPPSTETHHSEPEPVEDPADEYDEFDTIMESEGFTMISLDTLPSAKQHGFGSSAMTNGNTKPKEVGDRLRRKLPGTIEDLRGDSRARKSSSPVTTGLGTGSYENPSTHIPEMHSVHTTEQESVNYVNEIAYPELHAGLSPAKPTIVPKKRTFTSLAKLVRLSLALRGPFRPEGDEWSGKSNSRHKRRRLEGVFSTFNAETQRKLRAAMGLGQELAMRRMLAEEDEAAAIAAEHAASRFEEERLEKEQEEQEEQEEYLYNDFNDEELEEQDHDQPSEDEVEKQEQYIQLSHSKIKNSMQQSPMSYQKAQREAEWQLEREAVSRQAEMASNSRSVIYIDSDEDAAEDDGDVGLDYKQRFESETGNGFHEDPNDSASGLSPGLAPYSPQNVVPEPEPEPAPEAAPEPLEDEDDGYDDIWQLEANEHSHVSQRSEEEDSQAHAQPLARPLGNLAPISTGQDYLSSSPSATSEHNYVARFGPSKVRELREQKVDLSALLAEEDTPNRARYYNGTSTPRSVLIRPSGTQNLPINKSPVKDAVSRTPARIRLQPLSQSSPDAPSPRVPSPQTMSLGGKKSPNVGQRSSPMQEALEQDYHSSSVSNAALSQSASANADSSSTPQPRQPSREEPGSSWFSKITSFTPQWLKAPTRDRSSSVSTIPEEASDFEDEEEMASIESARALNEHLQDEPLSKQASRSPVSHRREPSSSQSPHTQQDPIPTMEEEDLMDERSVSREVLEEEEVVISERSISQDQLENEDAEPMNQHRASPGPRPLAVFGYFSDEHYAALRRIYRVAKRYPERFEYYDAPGRAAIIGDWIWTSDGHHGVPITEIQFAIIDRFAQELSRADIQYGGSGQVDWTEADLHRRLISIIIGEQIREERKAKANRGTSVDTWR
ncbi:hypothetical protein N7491_011056 [Penicillium cf. griseofulvum]|uniref:AT DNA binding protein n=1 Tax=Penicillium cf. griseofulvum TaxID=2972120 RepID=A0A9W9T6L8_9EURO|nr:hypothetical protein N7472_001375 [Penicillium cf. griseofulvum]KAJ5422611.1 hypothetical protein N7491_011056 [Penicillium cf. griseofulvum]KAJ5428788.1 hypothetical protein N7445_010242 [Penicillium cf. griseofulvum]